MGDSLVEMIDDTITAFPTYKGGAITVAMLKEVCGEIALVHAPEAREKLLQHLAMELAERDQFKNPPATFFILIKHAVDTVIIRKNDDRLSGLGGAA